jgi:predicted dehydrogenase
MRECGVFRKIYQPLNYEKAFRFFYNGNKPKDFINGYKELKTAYEDYLKQLDAEEMAETVKRAGVKCLVAFENRWNPPFVAVKDAIDSGELGDIQAMNARLNDTVFVPTKMLPWVSGNSSPAWLLQSHFADMASWLSGKRVKRVYAVGSKKLLAAMGCDTYDTIQTVLTYDDGASATITTSWILPEGLPTVFDGKFEIIGSKGASYVDLVSPVASKASGSRYDVTVTLTSEVHGKIFGAPCYMLNSFIDNIRLGTEPMAGLEDGIINTRVISAVHESIETGRAIDLFN